MSSSSKVIASQPADALLSEVGALKSLVDDLVRETRRSRVPDVPDDIHLGEGKALARLILGQRSDPPRRTDSLSGMASRGAAAGGREER